MSFNNYLELHKELFKDYLVFRSYLKLKGFENVSFSYKEYLQYYFIAQNETPNTLLNFLDEEND